MSMSRLPVHAAHHTDHLPDMTSLRGVIPTMTPTMN
jgi:hypothetical protein